MDPGSLSLGTTMDPGSLSLGTTMDPSSLSLGTTMDRNSLSLATTMDPGSLSLGTTVDASAPPPGTEIVFSDELSPTSLLNSSRTTFTTPSDSPIETTSSLFNLIIGSLKEKMEDLPSSSTSPPSILTTEEVSAPSGETEASSLQLNSEVNETFSDVLFNSLSSLTGEAELSSESNGVHIERGAISLLESARGGQLGERRPALSHQEPDNNRESPARKTFVKENGRLLITELGRTKHGTIST